MPPRLHVDIAWRSAAPADAALRRRVWEELCAISWDVSQMQALVHDAQQATGLQHAWLVPKMELRLPIYDHGVRYRLVIAHAETPTVWLVDESGKRIADVRLL